MDTPDLRITVNSFDVFDTLLTRRAIRPQRLFEEIERGLGATGFSQLRQAAELALMRSGKAFDLHDIYRHMTVSGQCSADVAERLKAAEVDAEFDHAAPVAENLSQVREGDLVVSDMYLPEDVIRRLLQHVGLRVFVHLFVSNAGKHFGTIWPIINRRFLIRQHLGDNLHSDVETAARHGIPARHYTGTQLAPLEALLNEHGLAEIAGIVRILRLGCPYPPTSIEATLWQLYAQANFPLLCIASDAIGKTRVAQGNGKILFSARDCHFMSDVFGLLFPQVGTAYIHVSRQVLWQERASITAALKRHGENPLIVDVASTGHSWYRYAEASGNDVDFFSLVRIDFHEPVLTTEAELAESAHLRFASLVRNSRLQTYTNGLEVINSAPYGSTQSLAQVGDWVIPVLAKGLELPPNCLQAMISAHTAAMTLLRKGRRRVLEELPGRDPVAVASRLIEVISSNPLLIELGKKFT